MAAAVDGDGVTGDPRGARRAQEQDQIGDLVGLSTKSESGTCFYILGQLAEGEPGYAEDEGCGSVDVQEFLTAWE